MAGVSSPLEGGGAILTDTQLKRLAPLIEACRPKGKTPPQDLRRTLSAILWRHQNGAKWRPSPLNSALEDRPNRYSVGRGWEGVHPEVA